MKQNNFVIVVPVYNSVNWIGKCIDSVHSQTYKNYTLIVVDDRSYDGTWNIVYNKGVWCLSDPVHIGKSIFNFKKGIEKASKSKDDIIVCLDGDDWLVGDFVLEYLNVVYQDKDVWLTYGQYTPLSNKYNNYCQPIEDFSTYRKSKEWRTSHLKTFKRGLWDLIKDNDLRDWDGEYNKYTSDRVFMYPMLEMAGNKHIKFIDKILYIYNDLNPCNDMKMEPLKTITMAEYLIAKPVYKEVDDIY